MVTGQIFREERTAQTEISRGSSSSLPLSSDQHVYNVITQDWRRSHPNGLEGSVPHSHTGLEVDTVVISHNEKPENPKGTKLFEEIIEMFKI